MIGAVRAWSGRLIRWLYPEDALCPLCRAERLSGAWLCPWCSDTFPWVRMPLCPACGRPVEAAGFCRDCAAAERIFDQGVGVAVYRGEAKAAVRALKYSGARWHAPWMGAMMGERVRLAQMKPEGVIPVPLHPARLKKRGYNQAGVLAEGAARYLDLPLWEDVIMRSVDTPTQTRLGREERLHNMRDAFGLLSPERVAGREVLLVDDIMTTGATLEACAAYLKKVGAIRVDTAVFAISTRNTDMQ
jgi:ComF family protein